MFKFHLEIWKNTKDRYKSHMTETKLRQTVLNKYQDNLNRVIFIFTKLGNSKAYVYLLIQANTLKDGGLISR